MSSLTRLAHTGPPRTVLDKVLRVQGSILCLLIDGTRCEVREDGVVMPKMSQAVAKLDDHHTVVLVHWIAVFERDLHSRLRESEDCGSMLL